MIRTHPQSDAQVKVDNKTAGQDGTVEREHGMAQAVADSTKSSAASSSSATASSSAPAICWKTYVMGDQEIHAVSGIDIEIKRASTSPSWARPAPANRR